ncbi:hypothetical protein Nmel_016588 [Mimus melanotis]
MVLRTQLKADKWEFFYNPSWFCSFRAKNLTD